MSVDPVIHLWRATSGRQWASWWGAGLLALGLVAGCKDDRQEPGPGGWGEGQTGPSPAAGGSTDTATDAGPATEDEAGSSPGSEKTDDDPSGGGTGGEPPGEDSSEDSGGTDTADGSTTGTDGSGTASTTGVPPNPALCGNNSIDPGESCDGTAIASDCPTASKGEFPVGIIRCNATCNGYDTSECYDCVTRKGCGCPGMPGGGECPAACTGGCPDSTTCVIDCEGASKCAEAGTIACPDDFHCQVKCIGTTACEAVTVECPATEGNCTLECQGNDACADVNLRCRGWSKCLMICGSGDKVCWTTTMHCAENDCTMACESDSFGPIQEAGPSCNPVDRGC